MYSGQIRLWSCQPCAPMFKLHPGLKAGWLQPHATLAPMTKSGSCSGLRKPQPDGGQVSKCGHTCTPWGAHMVHSRCITVSACLAKDPKCTGSTCHTAAVAKAAAWRRKC